MSENPYWKRRGEPWEYDSGPAKNLSWARLFSETPNYRKLGKEAIGREKFRWHFGPMFYRGRLKANSVKVLIIGQEGAQDESLAHRAFTGGTGARMQHFLNVLGITHSYLFVNTFVYPIFGQYEGKLKQIAQDPDSPIVQHRHDLFNYILRKNDVQLIVAVGTAAKETVETWVESRGGSCPDGTDNLTMCSGASLDPRTKIVGVRHPGGAGRGGSVTAIKATFQAALDQVQEWLDDDPTWLPVDEGATRDLSLPYKYSRAPIPFRDLPFGVTWRLGRGGTSSNRKDSQRSIQLFSAGGKYNNRGARLSYSDRAEGSEEGYTASPNDLPYEPPVDEYEAYDKGPNTAFAKLLAGVKDGLAWPDFNTLGVTAHPSLGTGPIYRGRLRDATVLILADQQSQDDLFNCRALTGEAGQRFQAYLEAIGINENYCILRSLPVDTLDLTVAQRRLIASHPQVQALYAAIIDKILDRDRTHLILTLGPVSADLIDTIDTGTTSLIKLPAWKEPNALVNWQVALPAIQARPYPRDLANPTFTYSGERTIIPTYDLPFGMLKWQGTSGDRARRAIHNGEPSPDYYKLTMPRWAFRLKPSS